MNIVEQLIDGKNRPMKKRQATLKIIIHYTANYSKGANASANIKYIDNIDSASCHYFIDDKNILLAVPCDEVAYHVGAKTYSKAGKDLIARGYQPNFCTVGIEMCVNSDGDFNKVKELTKKLTLMLLYKYQLTPDDILRHYDITGKNCPAMFVEDEVAWKLFIEEIRDMYIGFPKIYPKGKIVTKSGSLNIRKEPNTECDVIGSYHSQDIINIISEKNGWIETDRGYVSSSYVEKIKD